MKPRQLICTNCLESYVTSATRAPRVYICESCFNKRGIPKSPKPHPMPDVKKPLEHKWSAECKSFCPECESAGELKARIALVILQDSMRQINKMAMECKRNTWFSNLLTIRAIARLSNETLKTIEEKMKWVT